MYEKPKRNDVEYYIAKYSDRMDSNVLDVSHFYSMDFVILKKECISEARRLNYEYDDTYGTQGFFKWFNELAHVTAKKMVKEASQKKVEVPPIMAPINRFLEYDKPESTVDKINSDLIHTPEANHENNNNLNNETMAKKKKVCSTCKKEKSIDEFYNNKKTSDGKSSACKKCLNEAVKAKKSKTNKESPKVKKSKVIELPSTPGIGFSNDELEMMIAKLLPDLKEAEKEVSRIKGLISKLQARIKK